MRRVVTAFFVAALSAPLVQGRADQHRAVARLDSLPRLVLWAWERPTDLASVPSGVGVAYLAGTLFLSDDHVVVRPRFQPLVVPPAVPIIAVVRVERDPKRAARLVDVQADRAATAIIQLASRPRVTGLQIDFDATSHERRFYGAVLTRLRRAMPAGWPLSITALASWCMGDPWIRDLPIDEAVPMLFRMGGDDRGIRARLASGQDFSLAVCRSSVGVSLDEPLAHVSRGRRRYVFNAGKWNERAIAQAIRLRDK